jgi:hypothetical protein
LGCWSTNPFIIMKKPLLLKWVRLKQASSCPRGFSFPFYLSAAQFLPATLSFQAAFPALPHSQRFHCSPTHPEHPLSQPPQT